MSSTDSVWRIGTPGRDRVDRARGRWRSVGLLGLLLCAPMSVQATLPLKEEFLVYREDFQGEFVYPTVPEVDLISAGGISSFSQPTTPGGATLTGTEARAVIGGPDLNLFASTFFSGGDLQTQDFALRGEFDALTDVSQIAFESFAVSVVAEFDPNPGLLSLSVLAAVGVDSTGSAVLVVTEAESDGVTIVNRFAQSVFLSPGLEAAVLMNGKPFTIELEIDRVTGSATAHASSAGAAMASVGQLPLTLVTPASNFVGASSRMGVGFPGPLPPAIELDFESLSLYRPFTSHFDVDTMIDAADANVGDGLCATAARDCSLRAAVQESNARIGPGRIDLPTGRYALSLAGGDEDAAARGDLDVLDALEIRGAGRDLTILDGIASDRVIDVPSIALDTPMRFRDGTIRNGAATSGFTDEGGGLRNHGRLALEGCLLEESIAVTGGGIFNLRALWMDDCIVRSNTAQQAGGLHASVYNLPAVNTLTDIRNSAIVGNVATTNGGAELISASWVRIQNSTVSGNDDVEVYSRKDILELDHATIVGGAGVGLSVVAGQGPTSVAFTNSALEGTPACSPSAPFVQKFYSGHNASNDLSCGFSAPGSLEGMALGLMPLATVGATQAHVPDPTSPLVEAADAVICHPRDQVGMFRPIDSDANGAPECEIGAIEVPEARSAWLLAAGVAAIAGLSRRRALGGPGSPT